MDGREDGSVHCGTCTTKIRPVDSLLGASLISEQPRNLVLQQSRYSTDHLICWGHPYMTSALRGGRGVSPKEDAVREVA